MSCVSINLLLKSKKVIILIFVLLNSVILSSNLSITADIDDYLFEANLEYNDADKRFDGYNLFVVEKRDKYDWHIENRTLLITDMDGNIYFDRQLGITSVFVDYTAKFIDSKTVMYGEDDGIRLWNIETNETLQLDIAGHHDYDKNYKRNSYYSVYGYADEIDEVKYIFDYIKETRADGTDIWSISTREFLSLDQWCSYEDMLGESRDISHVNTLCYDEDDDSLYVNVRNVNTFYKIDIQTKEIVWGLGEYGDFTLYDINGQQKDVLFYHAHAIEKSRDNTFVLFDNDFHNETNANNRESRLLEIVIDEDKMQANVTWEWNSPIDYYSDIWGDCDVLPNNNRLGVFGTHTHPRTDLGARLVEVDFNGDIVWEMSIPEQKGFTYGVYTIERIHFAPIVSEPVFIDEGGGSGYLLWDVWYNFRAKTEFEGMYYINVDGVDVVTDQIVFPKYWQSEKIKYYTDLANVQSQDISLIVEDEAGHRSNVSESYSPIGSIDMKIITQRLSESNLIVTIALICLIIRYKLKKPKKKVNL
ncbi:MAG: hypothetical protein GOP50_05600 [Candidatus Heimdallarchaeota archaeon]|nr:hypothetical protein [Candidatus Heimdallarchaeota archaeon]